MAGSLRSRAGPVRRTFLPPAEAAMDRSHCSIPCPENENDQGRAWEAAALGIKGSTCQSARQARGSCLRGGSITPRANSASTLRLINLPTSPELATAPITRPSTSTRLVILQGTHWIIAIWSVRHHMIFSGGGVPPSESSTWMDPIVFRCGTGVKCRKWLA